MLNARTARQWLWDAMGKTVISVLCSTALLGVPSEAILCACSLCGEAHAAVAQHLTNCAISAYCLDAHTFQQRNSASHTSTSILYTL
eukprot:3692-Heterococcus_DN1.PRE.1